MEVVKFLVAQWDSVLVVLALLTFIIVLIVKKEYKLLDRVVFKLVTEAEKQLGGGTGALKLATVIDWVYPKIPAVIRIFITKDQLVKLIERVLEDAQEAWRKNQSISAYITAPDAPTAESQ